MFCLFRMVSVCFIQSCEILRFLFVFVFFDIVCVLCACVQVCVAEVNCLVNIELPFQFTELVKFYVQ